MLKVITTLKTMAFQFEGQKAKMGYVTGILTVFLVMVKENFPLINTIAETLELDEENGCYMTN